MSVRNNISYLGAETKDVFDTRSTIEYDSYSLLPISAKQYLNATDFLETKAEYDYRVLQPYKITDANDNITVFDFSPLGLLTATAVVGKGTQGDYKSATGTFYERYAPSKQMEYDFFAFKDEGNPVWVKTIQREQHYQQNPTSETIVKVEYTDGFGRLLQTRSQAEDVIFGASTGSGTASFGNSGLSPDQNLPNAPATGTERSTSDPLNVVVSGWKIYNNKGKVVEQYEPFFDTGFDYILPQLSTTGGIIAPQVGVKINMYYDPLGRVIRTVNPDNSEQRVIYGIPDALDTPDSYTPTSWEQYSYDANDLAPLTNPNSNVPQSNWFTPKSTLVDALGRTIQTTEHKAHYNTIGAVYEDVVMKYSYDIRGNLLEVKDPYERIVFEHIYDFRAPQKDKQGKAQPLPPLWTKHIDSGISTVVFDATEKPIESEDAKGAETLVAFDVLHRPSRIWAKDKTGETITLRQVLQYGDSAGLTNPENENLKGQIYKHYDEAGLLETPEYDFKGNLLENVRQCISDSELLSVFNGPPTNWQVNCYRVDWTGLPSILDPQLFETNSQYDALNRVTEVTYPEDANNNRKIGVPIYNRSGALEKISFDGTDYVNHIAYDAKGQRLLIAFGNGIMTRYAYDNRTFRTVRFKSEKYVQTGWTFTPQSGTTKQDNAFANDLVGNILDVYGRAPECGVGGTDSINRSFDYDPLYRLMQADGRENNPSTPFPWWDDTYRSTDNTITTAYTQHYDYDKLGNIQKLQHIGNSNFTRNFSYSSMNNMLDSVAVGSNTYNYNYDACGNQTQENSNRFFEWDEANNMRCFYNQAGTAEPTVYAQYLYDSGGNRIKKLVRTQGGSYESITYIDGVFEYKTDGTDEQTTTHILDSSSRIASIREGAAFSDPTPAVKYNLEDHLGSSMKLLDTNGTLVNAEEYYPFGETSFGSYAKKRYRYSGKERDSESGLYYYGARYYMAWACRFISCDALSDETPWLSPFVGFDDNPINKTDPDGNAAETVEGHEDRLRERAMKLDRKATKLDRSKIKRKLRLNRRANKIRQKIIDMAHEAQSRRGMGKMSNFSVKGEASNIPFSGRNHEGSIVESFWHPSSAPAEKELGFRAVIEDKSGQFKVIDIGTPFTTTEGKVVPEWSKNNEYNQKGLVNVDEKGNILDNNTGKILIPTVGALKGDALFKEGEPITMRTGSNNDTIIIGKADKDMVVTYIKDYTTKGSNTTSKINIHTWSSKSNQPKNVKSRNK